MVEQAQEAGIDFHKIRLALMIVREAYLGNPDAIAECGEALSYLDAQVDALLATHEGEKTCRD